MSDVRKGTPTATSYATPAGGAVAYPLYWRVRVVRPEWYGRRCRILIHGRRGNRLIEFIDGHQVVCPGAYLRRAV